MCILHISALAESPPPRAVQGCSWGGEVGRRAVAAGAVREQETAGCRDEQLHGTVKEQETTGQSGLQGAINCRVEQLEVEE